MVRFLSSFRSYQEKFQLFCVFSDHLVGSMNYILIRPLFGINSLLFIIDTLCVVLNVTTYYSQSRQKKTKQNERSVRKKFETYFP